MSKKRIFLGVDNTAGICTRLKKGFEQAGIEADFYSFGSHKFGFTPDKQIVYSSNSIVRKFQKAWLLAKLIFKYKYFIFLSKTTLMPGFKDIKLLKKFGKVTSIYFTGCDVRIPEMVAPFKWNTCVTCTQEYKDYVGCVVEKKKPEIREIEKIFDHVMCHDADSGWLTKDYISNYFPVNLEEFPAEKFKDYRLHSPIRILHAPTNEKYKGSQYVYDAIERLKNKYDIEFIKVTGVPLSELYKKIRESDLIIDSVIGGSYNLLSLESMAMYKPVVNFIRPNIWEKIKDDCPIYNVDPDNLYDVLDGILANPGQLIERSRQSREFIEKYHDAAKIAEGYYEIFERTN